MTYYCQSCDKSVSESEISDEHDMHCPDCEKPLIYLGQEEVVLSEEVLNHSLDLESVSFKLPKPPKIFLKDLPNPDLLHCEDILKYVPDNLEALMHLSLYYLTEKDYNQAKLIFKRILELYPKNIETHQHLADIYLNLNDYKNAIKILTSLSKILPQNNLVYYNLAIAYLFNKQPKSGKRNLLIAYILSTSQSHKNKIKRIILKIRKQLKKKS